MALVHINNLRVPLIIGTNDEERQTKQDILINISFKYKSEQAIFSDNLNQSVDYAAMQSKIIDKLDTSTFFLLETLTHFIADICLETPLVEDVTVKVTKPNALSRSDSVTVEITKQQPL